MTVHISPSSRDKTVHLTGERCTCGKEAIVCEISHTTNPSGPLGNLCHQTTEKVYCQSCFVRYDPLRYYRWRTSKGQNPTQPAETLPKSRHAVIHDNILG